MQIQTYAPADTYCNKILPLRQQMDVCNGWLKERLETVIPMLMDREGVDMWIVIAREYNEDPVIMSMLPAPAMSARRRTILVFARDKEGNIARYTVSRYGLDGYYEAVWNPDKEAQYDRLARLIMEHEPKSIGINTSKTFAFGDGLSYTEYVHLVAALTKLGEAGKPYIKRLQGAERLAVGWLEHRIPAELTVYPGLVEIGHAIIAEAFSSCTIQPGITTTDDVVWWMREKIQSMGLQAWFQPSIKIQAPGQGVDDPSNNPPGKTKSSIRKLILPGDLLHCDMGFHYLGLATDQQQHAYVRKSGEEDAPAGLKAALAEGNRLQDILMAQIKIGLTGNEVLAATLAQAKTENLTPSVYTHPLGYHGHAAGPVIGLWDRQDGVPGTGDYQLFDSTVYSIELNVTKAVPEWGGQVVRIALEEDAVLVDGQMRWLSGRQTIFHLI
ncbi:MAG: M24 family metallopeptidase [Chloroflexota bacterium]